MYYFLRKAVIKHKDPTGYQNPTNQIQIQKRSQPSLSTQWRGGTSLHIYFFVRPASNPKNNGSYENLKLCAVFASLFISFPPTLSIAVSNTIVSVHFLDPMLKNQFDAEFNDSRHLSLFSTNSRTADCIAVDCTQ